MDKSLDYVNEVIVQSVPRENTIRMGSDKAAALISQIFKDVEHISRYERRMESIKKEQKQELCIFGKVRHTDDDFYAKVSDEKIDELFDTSYVRESLSCKVVEVREILYELADELPGLPMNQLERTAKKEFSEDWYNLPIDERKEALLKLVKTNNEDMLKFIEEFTPNVINAKRFDFEESIVIQMNVAVLVDTLKQYDDIFGAQEHNFAKDMQSKFDENETVQIE